MQQQQERKAKNTNVKKMNEGSATTHTKPIHEQANEVQAETNTPPGYVTRDQPGGQHRQRHEDRSPYQRRA